MTDTTFNDNPSCPFCTFSVLSNSDQDVYALMHHLEISHPENGESPFIVTDEGGSNVRLTPPEEESANSSLATPDDEEGDDVYIECPAQCGEAITLTELSSHMELHGAEGILSDDPTRPRSRNASSQLQGGRASSSDPQGHSDASSFSDTALISSSPKKNRGHGAKGRHKDGYGVRDWKEFFFGPSSKKTRSSKPKKRQHVPRRLGKSELGPHAYEDQMPTWLRKQIERGARVTVVNQISPTGHNIRVEQVANETPGMVPVLAQLCEQDPALSKVFLCHPGVKHVMKEKREGGFCGYRNIQMMVSHIQATQCAGCEHFPGRIPSILELQDLIERAWDLGINAVGRIETGGIRGTRKYIGTPEAQALFCSLHIECEANAFNETEDTSFVYESVLQAVLQYFSLGVTNPSHKVYQTHLPPIYFQHPGHSLTIVGLEIRKSGAANLLVLDPMFKTSPGISRLVGSRFRCSAPDKLLKAYRRGHSYLSKYHSFEMLTLTSTPSVLMPLTPSPSPLPSQLLGEEHGLA